MIHISQNKKIAFVAVLMFCFSFSFIWMFLNNSNTEFSAGTADLLNATHFQNESSEEKSETNMPEIEEGPIVVIDIAGEVMFANDDFCELLSVNCEQFIGKLFFDYISGDDLPGLVAEHTRLVQDGEKVDGLGPFRMLRDSDEVLVLFNASPQLGKDEKVNRIVLSAKDLTKQVEAMQ